MKIQSVLLFSLKLNLISTESKIGKSTRGFFFFLVTASVIIASKDYFPDFYCYNKQTHLSLLVISDYRAIIENQ